MLGEGWYEWNLWRCKMRKPLFRFSFNLSRTNV